MSRASRWPCPQPPTTASTRWRLVKSTTAYGHRRRTGPGRLRTKLYRDGSPKQPGTRCSSSCLTRSQWGVRPEVLAEPRIADLVSVAPILDAPVPQTVEQLPDVLQFFDTLSTVPEQVIEVPKILPEDVPMRAVLRDPKLVEQLVEVPTIVSYSWLQLRMEQHVDIPVPGGGGPSSGLQGFPPGQSSTALPSSQERISERIVEQIVDIHGGGLQDFRPGQSSSSSLHVPVGISGVLGEPGDWVFSHFSPT